MKRLILKECRALGLLMVVSVLLKSSMPSMGGLYLSEATNEIYMGVCGQSTIRIGDSSWTTNNSNIKYDDKLAILFFCRTGAVQLLVPWDQGVYVGFQMRDSKGKEVVKTTEGLRWGSDIKNFPATPGSSKRNRMATWKAMGAHDNIDPAISVGPQLPAPNELFEMKESGIYALTVEVHLMKQIASSNSSMWTHIAIPPLSFKVEKPPEVSK